MRKLCGHAPLLQEDIDLLEGVCRPERIVPAREDLILEGDARGPVFIMLEGWGCRYKLLPEGTRQITSFLMPGDCCDLHASLLDEMDHSIATLTEARVAMVPRSRMEELIFTRPHIALAFRWAQLVDEDTLRAWITSMGRRDSTQRVAHLMCELYVRARNIGLTDNERFELPLTQLTLGDALGLTPVHVNRVLKKLRLSGVMSLTGGTLLIADISALARVAGFDDNYLHSRVKKANEHRGIALAG